MSEHDPRPEEVQVTDAVADSSLPEEPAAAEDVRQAEAAVEGDIARIAAERDDYLDALRRLQADFENYKKRVLKQQTEHLERAAETLVEKLLPALDTFDLALAHGEGFDQVHSIERAVRMGSVNAVVEPASLRRSLIDAVERGIHRNDGAVVVHEHAAVVAPQ